MSDIRLLDLGARSYRDLGRAHGEAWGADAAALFGIRFGLTRKKSPIRDPGKLVELARLHLAPLRDYDLGLYEELLGIAETSGLEPWQVLLLNHYTDFRDVPPEAMGCSVVYAPLPDGPVAAQTWDMHGTAEPYVGLLKLEPPDGPPVTLFTLAGCLALAGMNALGVAVCINNLTPNDARIGVNWPTVVRRMLREPTARAARDVLLRSPLGSGHNYLIADEREVFNVETTATQARVTHDDPRRAYWHTNHYTHPDLLPYEVPLLPSSTSRGRYAKLTHELSHEPRSLADVWTLLGSHDGYPGSICTHLPGDDPDASKTCGAIVCDIPRRRVLALRGCVHDQPYREVGLEVAV
jgi:isopenicillin-N N-acyltransferase-like protein